MDHTNIELPSNRKFGLFFTLIFLIAAIYFYLDDHEILLYMFDCCLSLSGNKYF